MLQRDIVLEIFEIGLLAKNSGFGKVLDASFAALVEMSQFPENGDIKRIAYAGYALPSPESARPETIIEVQVSKALGLYAVYFEGKELEVAGVHLKPNPILKLEWEQSTELATCPDIKEWDSQIEKTLRSHLLWLKLTSAVGQAELNRLVKKYTI